MGRRSGRTCRICGFFDSLLPVSGSGPVLEEIDWNS